MEPSPTSAVRHPPPDMGNCFGRPPRPPTEAPPVAPTHPPPPQSKRAKAPPPPFPPNANAARLARARASAATGVLSLTHLDLPAIPPDVTAPPPLGPAVRTVAISHNRLTAVPSALAQSTPGVTRVDASHNRLSSIEFCRGWARLRRLDVAHNALGGAAVAALLLGSPGGGGGGGGVAPLDALEELDASHNPLGPVLSPPPAAAAAAAGGACRPLPALRVLRLEECGLKAIAVGLVGALAPSLIELHVGGNADLTALPPDVTALGRLRVLAASGCALTALPPDLFSSLPELTALRLGGNTGLTMAALTGMDGYGAYEKRRVGGVNKALGGGLHLRLEDIGGGGGIAEPADR